MENKNKKNRQKLIENEIYLFIVHPLLAHIDPITILNDFFEQFSQIRIYIHRVRSTVG